MSLLNKEKEDSIDNIKAGNKLQDRITDIKAENTSKKRELENLENEYNRLTETKAQLRKEIYQAQRAKDWIQGTWEYSDYGITCRVEINEENLKVYMDGSLEYNGIYSIDRNEIKYSMGKGMSGTIGLDNTNHRLMADNYNSFTRISYSPKSYSQPSSPRNSQLSSSSSSASSNTTVFHSLSDVWSYLESHTWRSGHATIKIRTQSLIVNGEQYLAAAPQVTNFTSTSATITVNLIPSGTLIFNVYPQKGVMYDNVNNTYTLK